MALVHSHSLMILWSSQMKGDIRQFNYRGYRITYYDGEYTIEHDTKMENLQFASSKREAFDYIDFHEDEYDTPIDWEGI